MSSARMHHWLNLQYKNEIIYMVPSKYMALSTEQKVLFLPQGPHNPDTGTREKNRKEREVETRLNGGRV